MRQPTYRFRYRIAPQVPRTRLLPKHSPFSAGPATFCASRTARERPNRALTSAFYVASASGRTRAADAHMQVHMQNVGRGTCRGRTLPTGRNYLCVATAIRFPGRENGANAGSGQATSKEPCGGLDALLPAMRKEIDKYDRHGHRESCQTDHETRNYALSERLAAAGVLTRRVTRLDDHLFPEPR